MSRRRPNGLCLLLDIRHRLDANPWHLSTHRSTKGDDPIAHRFEIYKDKAGEFRVRFKYNSETIFSTEGYSDKSGAKRAVESIRKHVGDAELVEAD